MGAKLCIENRTEFVVAIYLEQTAIRYWAKIPPHGRVIWHPDNIHVSRGLYTIRAIDASSATFDPPNMTAERAKTAGTAALLGVGGAALVAGAVLIVVPGLGVVLTGVGGAIALLGSAGAAAGATASYVSSDRSLRPARRRGVHIGTTKLLISATMSGENQQLHIEKVAYDEEDERKISTCFSLGHDNNVPCQPFPRTDIPPQDYRQFIIISCITRQSYAELCKRFLDTLDIPPSLLDEQYNKCFCDTCSSERGDSFTILAGNPRKMSAVPRQYMKFGVKIPLAMEIENVFQNWHICYHGTAPENITSILNLGRLLKPGDVTPQGVQRAPGPGRFTEENAPHDVKQYFFSPTPKYCEYGNLYASPVRFDDSVTGKTYLVRTVLQVRLKPNSYEVGPQTMGAVKPIDEKFPNNVLEWFTNREGVHCIYGILVKMLELEAQD